MHLYKIILILTVLISQGSFSQSEDASDNKSTLYTKDGNSITGIIVYEDFLTTDLVIFTGDTITIKNSDIAEKVELKDHFRYPKRRFHYKEGFHIDGNLGLGFSGSGAYTYSDISLNKRITTKVTAGLGIGSQTLFTSFPLIAGPTNLYITISNRSIPIFAQGKYYVNRLRRSMYIHGRLGYTLGKSQEFNANVTNNGFLAAYGIGFTKATKGRMKTFFQITQSHNYSTGTAFNLDVNGPLTFDYNIWFNRLGMSFGLEYNLSSKYKRTKKN
ncbi:MAG: hypothetical protein QMC39_02285 [Flavobacteriales bacterium]|jgi:hypothetical protein|tara:strand:- start:103 stop:918 length:816 start_codon:yes stop_codon:yes gene_type:complete